MRLLFACILSLAAFAAHAADQTLRVGALKFGTAMWELETIRSHGFDEANGVSLDVAGFASGNASRVALLAGDVDAIVADWIWVARQRAAGRDIVFIPFSKAVGSLMVPPGSPAKTLADLKGASIGVAGGALDKSWLILRAYAEQTHEMDLAAETEQVFAAPPLIHRAALGGDVAGAVNYWRWQAKLSAAGHRTLISVAEAAEALGLDPDLPLLGYVLTAEAAAAHGDALHRASQAAKRALAQDAAWSALRPLVKPADDAEFDAIIAAFREGDPGDEAIGEAAAARFFAVMRDLGGEALVGDATALPEGVFWPVSR